MLSIKSSTQILNPKSEKSHISSTLIPLPQKSGHIFGLVRFLGKSDAIRETISEAIHERLSRFKDTLEGDVHIARRFEQLLQALNEDIAQIISEHKIIPISDAHIVIGVVHGNQVFLSGIGNLSALFMHRTAQQRYVIYELSEQFKDKDDQSWDKLFATVLDGELHPGDIFYVATRISAREITLAELQDILTTLPASGSLKRIQQYLNRDTVYGGICFQISDKPETGAPKKENPMHSVEQLDQTKDKTATLLGDQAPDVGGFITKLTSPIIKKLSAPGTRGYKSLIKRAIKVLLQILTILIALLVKILAFIIKYLVIGVQRLPSFLKKGHSVVKQQPHPKERINAGINWFNKLPSLTKYAGLTIIILIVILVSTITISNRRQVKNQQEDTFNTIVNHIEEKMDSAQASLIYDDENQARLHLQEATALLETLDAGSKSQESTSEELRSQLQEVLYDIQKITPADLTTLATIDGVGLTKTLAVSYTIYAIDADNTLYRLNTLESDWQTIETNSGAIEQVISSTATEDGDILIMDSEQQLGRLVIESATINPIVSGSNDLLSVEDVIEYNESIYVLSAAGKQIIKMRERGDGYEAGTPWISSTDSDTDLADARALAIDGNIYVLTANNIVSLLSGRQQTFNLDSISPSLNNPIDIWTDSESKYIYILEPIEYRVIVIDKEGALVAQYTNDLIANAHSMIVQETNNSIIIVSDTTAYTFAADHLLQ